MVTLSSDEVALLKSILTALRGIKVRDIDKALLILSKADRGRQTIDDDRGKREDEKGDRGLL